MVYMPNVAKKLHHYVPRFYLQAWAQKKLIYCLQENEIFRPNLQGVAAQNYFYSLEEISSQDAEFLRPWGSPKSGHLWSLQNRPL
jgi:hypothetical protein